jgi:hypothetical protein
VREVGGGAYIGEPLVQARLKPGRQIAGTGDSKVLGSSMKESRTIDGWRARRAR